MDVCRKVCKFKEEKLLTVNDAMKANNVPHKIRQRGKKLLPIRKPVNTKKLPPGQFVKGAIFDFSSVKLMTLAEMQVFAFFVVN